MVDEIISYYKKLFLVPAASGQNLADFCSHVSVSCCPCKDCIGVATVSPPDGGGTAFCLLLLIWINLLQAAEIKGPFLKGIVSSL